MDLKVNIKFAFWGDGGAFVLVYSGGGMLIFYDLDVCFA